MNPKIEKITDEIERVKAKIAQLQELLPGLERKKTDLENTEIVRAVRSANVAPGDIASFIGTIKSVRYDSRANDAQGTLPSDPGTDAMPGNRQEDSHNEQE